MKKFLSSLLVMAVAFSVLFLTSSVAFPKSPVTITVITLDPLDAIPKAWASAWEEETGNKVNIITVPFPQLYEKIMIDFITGTGAYDVVCFIGGWSGDIMGGGWLIPVDELWLKYGFPDWGDVVPSVQKGMSWGTRVYSVPIDGDYHMFYYRKDALENPVYQGQFKTKYGYTYNVPPKTWEEVRDIAEFFNGWDWDKDGEDNYGCVFIAARKTQAMWSLIDVAAQYVTAPGVPSKYQGVTFFDPETMEPLMKTPGWIRGMEMIRDLAKVAPPGLLTYGYTEERIAMVQGKAAMAWDWADIGIMEQYPEEYGSVVKGKLGYAKLPGASKYWDREQGKWIDELNQVQLLNNVGWMYAIPKTAKHPAEAYQFATFVSDAKQSIYDVAGAHGYTGANPYRRSHFETDLFVKFGWNRDSAKAYLDTIWDVLNDPRARVDLRIPGRREYYDTLDRYLNEVLAGTMTPKTACEGIYDEWIRITERRGKDKQLNFYRESLGLPPLK